jgi:hypothetical protein
MASSFISHSQQAQHIFQGNLDSDTKLQLAAVALQALDWRCKHLTQRLRRCLNAIALNCPNASFPSKQSSSRSSPANRPLNILHDAVMESRRIQGEDLSPVLPVDAANSGFNPITHFCPWFILHQTDAKAL